MAAQCSRASGCGQAAVLATGGVRTPVRVNIIGEKGMRKIVAIILSCWACAAGLAAQGNPIPVGEPTPRPSGPGWVDLLDADHASGWQLAKEGEGAFEIEDGVLHIAGTRPMGYAGYMAQKFGDFQLHIAFKTVEKTNSGVMFRAEPESPAYTGMEIQVLDDHGKDPNKHSCGSLFDVATPMFNLSRPTGEWNTFDMTCKGKHLEVVMNGWKILDVDLSKMTMPIGKFSTPYNDLPLEGYLFLQDHGHELWYRDILIKKL
jgi:hypothetical protein